MSDGTYVLKQIALYGIESVKMPKRRDEMIVIACCSPDQREFLITRTGRSTGCSTGCRVRAIKIATVMLSKPRGMIRRPRSMAYCGSKCRGSLFLE